MTIKQKANVLHAVMLIVISAISIIYIYPVFLMVINSIKPFGEVLSDVLSLPKELALDNYSFVFDKMNYLKLFVNNVMITLIGVTGIVFLSAAAGFILDRRQNKYTSFARAFIIIPMLIPFQTIMITLLKTMSVLHLSGSRVGLGIQYWGFGIPLAVFIYNNFMKTIPREIDESAYIDGATTFRTFISIIFPLMKPVTATIIVLNVMWIWNDFLLPLLMVNTTADTRTLVLAAYTFVGQFNTQWHYAMTAMVLAIAPSVLFFIIFQRNIVDGVVSGAVKG